MGGGWKSHPSLPSRPFLPLGLLKKLLLPASPAISERSLFLPFALFHDLREPHPQSSPSTRPSFCFSGSSQPSTRPTRTSLQHTHRSVPNPGKHAPFPLFPESAPPNPRLSRPPSQRSLFSPLPVPWSAIRPQRVRLPPGRERADASAVPAPRPPPGPGSGFTHGCPELLRVARAGSRRSRLAHPSLAPWGREGGCPGRGSSERAPALPRAPPLPVPCQPPHSGVLATSPVHSSHRSLACLFWGRFCASSFWSKLEHSVYLDVCWGSVS